MKLGTSLATLAALVHLAGSAFAQVETAYDGESAPPAEAHREATPPPVMQVPPPRPKPPVSLRFDAGYAPRKLFTIPVTGADLGFAAGAQPTEHGAFWGAARVLVGGTENGLRVWDVRVAGEAEAVFDRLRLGGGLGVFVLGVGRAARDETILSWGPDGRATARFDVTREDAFAIFLRASIGAGYDLYDGSLFWGPTLGAGVELDVAGTRKR